MAGRKIRKDLDGSVFIHHDNGTFTVLTAGDDVPDGATVGDHLLAGSGEPNPEQAGDPNAVDLDGSIDDVLARVGDDQATAQRYLAAEQAEDKPRKGLVDRLEKLAAGPQ